MVAKEIIQARWKLIIGGGVTLAAAVLLTAAYGWLTSLLPITNAAQLPEAARDELALMMSSFDYYVWTQWFADTARQVLGLIAAILGAGLIAGEVSKGTIFFLLSKPVGRERVLLTKYAVSGAILLAVALLGSAGLVVTAAVMGRPQPLVGVLLSTLLLWLGTMFVLGLALLFSVLFDDVLRPAVLAIVVTVLLGVPGYFPAWRGWSLPGYWANLPAYLGTGFPTKELLVCLVAAVLPMAAALAVFRERAY